MDEKVMPDKIIISQGAEAIIYKYCEGGVDVIEKQRFAKYYRHPTIDAAVRKKRTKAETKALTLANERGVPSPKLIRTTDFSIIMEQIVGETLTHLHNQNLLTDDILKQLGTCIKQIHNAGIIHNDLTTSNFMFRNGVVLVIDFGLAFLGNCSLENRAVDLYVLEKSIIALTGENRTNAILEGYQPAQDLVSRLDEVRKRGRKK